LIQIAAPDRSSNAAKEDFIMRALIQATEAYELSVGITPTAYGHNLKLISLVPNARRPEDHVQFQGLLSTVELGALRDSINQALRDSPPV
jgi:hypothetical protein